MKKGSMDTGKKGLIGLGALVILTAGAILGSDPLYRVIDDIARPEIRSRAVAEETVMEETAAPSGWKDGEYSYEAPEFDDNGYKDLVNMTVRDGRITELAWDCVDKDGKKKSRLSMDGEYVMTEDGPKWYEQADAAVKYVLENQSPDGLINQVGHTDAIASVTMNLSGFTGGVEDCLKQASR